MNALDPVTLTQELVRFDTINPPGDEAACIAHLAGLLEAAGLACERVALAEGRPNLIARIGGAATKAPLGFTGHVDVVPLGNQPWSHEPFAGEIAEGRLYGRGSSDMKSGVAAFVTAACALAPRLEGTAGLVLAITAGEETGAEGARALAESGRLGKAGALVVAEPTGNRPLVAHKGALHLRLRTRGKTAHGSMPEEGVNAILKAKRLIERLESFDLEGEPHPLLGRATLNVGTIHGGINVNSVPDRCEIGLDIRTVPGMEHARVLERLRAALGEELAELEVAVDVPAVETDPAEPFVAEVFEAVEALGEGAPAPAGVSYFTDASILTPALGDPATVILGPGEATQAHQTDEYCRVERIGEAERLYEGLIARWCGL